MEIKLILNADNTITYNGWTIESNSEIHDEFYGMSRTVYTAYKEQSSGKFIFTDDHYTLKSLIESIDNTEI